MRSLENCVWDAGSSCLDDSNSGKSDSISRNSQLFWHCRANSIKCSLPRLQPGLLLVPLALLLQPVLLMIKDHAVVVSIFFAVHVAMISANTTVSTARQ